MLDRGKGRGGAARNLAHVFLGTLRQSRGEHGGSVHLAWLPDAVTCSHPHKASSLFLPSPQTLSTSPHFPSPSFMTEKKSRVPYSTEVRTFKQEQRLPWACPSLHTASNGRVRLQVVWVGRGKDPEVLSDRASLSLRRADPQERQDEERSLSPSPRKNPALGLAEWPKAKE